MVDKIFEMLTLKRKYDTVEKIKNKYKGCGEMSIFDEIGKKITDVGQETATKAKKFTEIAKLNSLIGDKEKEISNLFVELGHSYYERKKNDESPEETVKQITAFYEEIEAYKKQIVELKGFGNCPQCGAEVTNGAVFCNSCGAKLNDEKAKAEEAKAEEEKTCPQCGMKVGESDLFCNSCGNKLA